MHWATLRRHSDLFWVATSASCQVIPILNKSLLVVLLQFVHGRPGPLLNPGTSQCNACRGMHWWSIRITCPSQRSLLSLSMSSMLCCVVLKIQETNWTFWPYLHYGKLIYRFLQLVFKTKTKLWHHKLLTMTTDHKAQLAQTCAWLSTDILSLSMSSMLCCVVLKIQETNWTFWPYLHYGKLIYRFLQLVFKTKTKPWHHKLSTMTSLLITKPNWHKPAPDSPLTTQHWLTALRSMFWNAASEMA